MPSSKLPVPLQNAESGSKKSSPLGFIGALVALTVLAAAAGGVLAPKLMAPAAPSTPSGGAAATAAVPTPGKYAADANIKELPAIVTNLASPADAMVRVQAAMVLDDKAMPDSAAIAAEVGEDILAYLRTLSVPQLEGAAGLEYLHEDLAERAAIRTNGKVRELMIESLVVQ